MEEGNLILRQLAPCMHWKMDARVLGVSSANFDLYA